MKKLFLISMFNLIALFAFSQNYILYVSGHVFELNSTVGVPNHEVFVQTDTTNPGGGNLNVVVTNENGEYYGEINMNGMPVQGYVTVFTYDCNQQIISYYLPYFPGAAVTADFYICTEPGVGDCTNSFTWVTNGQNSFTFDGQVFPPADASYMWDFGDGFQGYGQEVVHNYDANLSGSVIVFLTTVSFDTASGDSCFASSTQEIWLNGQGGDCENWFTYQTNDYLTFSFQGYAFPDSINTQYFWDFGDGNSAWGPNTTHTFIQGGVAWYNVCLYTFSYSPAGDSCSAVSCQEVPVGNQGGDCQNMFWYENAGYFTFTFNGESFPAPAQHYFWNFGDGSTGSGQFTTHTFPENAGDVFLVTLQTISMDPATGDSCMATSAQEVWVNGGTGCESWFDFFTNELNVTFIGHTTSQLGTNYSWIIENGFVGYGQEFTYTFPEAGTYLVTLYTIDSSGCEAWFNNEVIVEGGGSQGYTLNGTVYMDSIPADYGSAGLFGINANGTVTFSISDLVNGGFVFENVPEGQYYLVAGLSPESAQFFNYFPTYYGDVLFWLNATVIELGEPQNPYDIHLVPTSWVFQGPGIISGNVYSGSYKSGGEGGITVMLMNQDGTPLAYQVTDGDGFYEFSNMNYGTYKISVEMPGMESETASVTLNESSTNSEINFVIEQNQVFLSTGNGMIAGSLLALYPNPVTENVTVDLRSNLDQQVTITVFNAMGQQVSMSTQNLLNGINRMNIHTAFLPEGIYTLKAASEQGIVFITKFLKSK